MPVTTTSSSVAAASWGRPGRGSRLRMGSSGEMKASSGTFPETRRTGSSGEMSAPSGSCSARDVSPSPSGGDRVGAVRRAPGGPRGCCAPRSGRKGGRREPVELSRPVRGYFAVRPPCPVLPSLRAGPTGARLTVGHVSLPVERQPGPNIWRPLPTRTWTIRLGSESPTGTVARFREVTRGPPSRGVLRGVCRQE